LEEAKLNHASSVDRDMAGANFIELLEIMSDVIIQDSVILIGKFQHPIFNNSIFKTQSYEEYSNRSIARMAEAHINQPEHILIKKAMPKLVDYMKIQFDIIQANSYSYKEEVILLLII
jgi:hypothetical protein